ncbi:MAG TPA: dynamin family protein [Alphaproteobacteria bacterium]|nr:dynamin family protein [Alphaproteobacteria bacterium]
MIEELIRDMKSSYVTLVVVGEFNRGKSTLVNALLGMDLLPMDITPTTATINVIHAGSNPCITAYFYNGSTEKMPIEKGLLSKYVVDDAFDPDTVKYIDVVLDSKRLPDGLYIVDTPGVNDLNNHRAEITYRFIPNADAVLFLLDATAPVSKSEAKFIEENIKGQGVQDVIFIAGHYDDVDLEENTDLLNQISGRVSSMMGIKCDVFPLNARRALTSSLEENEEALEESGLLKIRDMILEKVTSGEMSRRKTERLAYRTGVLISHLIKDCRKRMQIQRMEKEELTKAIATIQKSGDSFENKKEAIQEFINERVREMEIMTGKSIESFIDELKEKVFRAIDLYTGADFKNYIESNVPHIIKSGVKEWVRSHNSAFNKFFTMLEIEIAKGLAKEFKTQIKMTAVVPRSQTNIEVDKLDITAKDISSTLINAGLITGAAAIVPLLLGAPVFIPFISLGLYPFLRDKMLKDNLKDAKDQLKTELNKKFPDLRNEMTEMLCDVLRNNAESIRNRSIERFQGLVNDMRTEMEKNLKVKNDGLDAGTQIESDIVSVMEKLESMKSEIIQQE